MFDGRREDVLDRGTQLPLCNQSICAVDERTAFDKVSRCCDFPSVQDMEAVAEFGALCRDGECLAIEVNRQG